MVIRCFFVLMVLSVSGIGCTESGAPISSTIAPSSDPATSSGGVGVNGSFTGEIWVKNSINSKRINLQTGKETVIPGDAYPSRDGSVYVEHLHSVSRELDDASCGGFDFYNDVDRISIINTRSRDVTSSFDTIRPIAGTIRLSPDGERIGMFASEIELCTSNDDHEFYFMVFSKDGELLYRDEFDNISSFDWHPDGRLVVFKSITLNDNWIQIDTYPGSYDFETQIKFQAPPGVSGYRGLRVGPTGNDAVLEATSGGSHFLSTVSFRYGAPHHFPLFEDLGETDLFEHEPGIAQLNGVTFSPDGQHLLVTEGYTAGAVFFPENLPPITDLDDLVTVPVYVGTASYIVPVGVREQAMPPAQYSENIRPVLTNRSGSPAPLQINPLLNVSWTPAID